MLASRRATVLSIDDAHWLHPGSAELLLILARETANVPLLLSVGVRTNEPSARPTERLVDGLHRQGAEVIEPPPLQRRDIPTLVTRHLGGKGVEPSLADVLFEQSAGNPLFCLELARDAVDRDVIALTQGTWRATRPFEAARVPRSVARLVRAKCRRLSRTSVEILDPGRRDRGVRPVPTPCSRVECHPRCSIGSTRRSLGSRTPARGSGWLSVRAPAVPSGTCRRSTATSSRRSSLFSRPGSRGRRRPDESGGRQGGAGVRCRPPRSR